MQCPYCRNETSVTETRVTSDGMRRRRVCNTCKRRFTTYERVGSPGIKVHKRDGRVEPFDRDKLVVALHRVTAYRNIAADALERIATDLEAQLVDDAQKAVSWSELAELVHGRLAALDAVAARRFAADYADDGGEVHFAAVAPPPPSPQLGLPLPDPD